MRSERWGSARHFAGAQHARLRTIVGSARSRLGRPSSATAIAHGAERRGRIAA
jgi:hypothetical protein